VLSAGEQVLALLPNPHHSLKLKWIGPYKVLRQITSVDNEIEMPRHRNKRECHINLLKKYCPPERSFFVIEEGETEMEVDAPVWEDEGISESLYPIGSKEVPEIEKCGAHGAEGTTT
jgi:hypothetical protein